jgi:hypothetical protein
MKLNSQVLSIDVKVQDKYRKWFSTLGSENLLTAKCVILGDSDIDYELSGNMNNAKILNAPYAVDGVRYKLIYNGVGKNLAGSIKCFARKVLSTGDIQGLYTYPANETFTTGVIPPSLGNGKNWEKFTFNDNQMGYILYFSTVLDYYFDADGVKKRLVEAYDYTFDWDGSPTTASGYEYVIDNDNGSLLLSKQNTTGSPIGLTYRGSLTIKGQFSQKTKKILFNF